jgi:hypothetical protein
LSLESVTCCPNKFKNGESRAFNCLYAEGVYRLTAPADRVRGLLVFGFLW